MLLRTVVAPLLGAVCTVVADDAGRCVVVDPGAGVVEDVRSLVSGQGWRPVGVLVTHGHVDHTWSAAELCDGWGVPLHVHADDAYRLDDPFGSLGPLGRQLADMARLPEPSRPADVRTFTAGPDGYVDLVLDAGGPDAPPFVLRALHVPGHTQGSTTYLLDAGGPVALTGDVLFAGSMGRTDLPGGDPAAMTRSLARLAGLDPLTAVRPGHGPTSTIGRELRTNPYLRAVR